MSYAISGLQGMQVVCSTNCHQAFLKDCLKSHEKACGMKPQRHPGPLEGAACLAARAGTTRARPSKRRRLEDTSDDDDDSSSVESNENYYWLRVSEGI
jgi:hypothetical protein